MKIVDEARKCVCPQLCVATAIFEVKNPHIIEGTMLCMANRCMMWRWRDKEEYYQESDGKRYGYCGLAGKP